MQFLKLVAMMVAILPGLLPDPAAAQIVIGVADTLTGALGWNGEQVRQGVGRAVRDLNAAGGVLGQIVEMSLADDACDPDQAIAAAEKLRADGAVFVVGHGCSGASIPASRVYEEAGIIQISASSTNPALTDAGRRNVFRLIGRDDRQGFVAGNLLADRWAGGRIAILHDGRPYGLGLAESTRAQLHSRGMQEALFEEIVPDAADYSSLVQRLLAAGIDVIYAGVYHNDAALLVRQARSLGLGAQLIAGDDLVTEEFAVIAGPAAEGTLMTFNPDPRRFPQAAVLVRRFRADGVEPEGVTVQAYAAVQVWAEAVRTAGTTAAGPVAEVLHARPFSTVIGDVRFDAKGDWIGAEWVWYVWHDQAYQQVSDEGSR